MTQWGKIKKKSESNDGKADSELLESPLPLATLSVLRLVLRLRRRNGREGMVADNLAKNREHKRVC